MCIAGAWFGGFQALMPTIGWVCVHTVVQHFRAFEKFIPWIALALLGYIGFDTYGLNILAAFDEKPSAEAVVDGKCIYGMDKLESFCRNNKILMGIITVPAKNAQEVCDQLIRCGIKAVWSFAPAHLEVPSNILVQYENMATSLAVLSMHLRAQMKEKM